MHWLTSWQAIGFIVVEGVLRIALGAHVILRRRPVATSLAWLTIILFVPVAGLVLYFLIGGISLGTRRVKRYEELTRGLEAQGVFKLLAQRRLAARKVDEEFAPIACFGTAVSGLPPLRGNALRLYGDNVAMLEALKADIDAAKHHVHLCYYIWAPDKAGTTIAMALVEAVKRGVSVRVLVDGAGSRTFLRHSLCREMRAAGIKVVESLPTHLWRMAFRRLDLRNHRKIAVFDGTIGYCGSQNILDVGYKSPRWKKAGKWTDATVRVEGPAAQELAVTFLRDWQMDSDEQIASLEAFLPPIPTPSSPAAPPTPAASYAPPAPAAPAPAPPNPSLSAATASLPEPAVVGDASVQLIASGPGPTPQAIHQGLLTAIYAARREIVMTTPYFVPDAALLEAILAAVTRGVRVALVLPDVSDAPIVAAAGRANYEELLDAGVELYEYQGGTRGVGGAGRLSGSGSRGSRGAGEQGSKVGSGSGEPPGGSGVGELGGSGGSGGGSSGGLLHSKIMTMDGKFSMVGSTNMDQRSFFLNFEATLFIYDAAFACEVLRLQAEYLRGSRRIDAAAWKKRGVWERLRDNSAQLLGPLL